MVFVVGVNPRRPIFPLFVRYLSEGAARRALLDDLAGNRLLSEVALLCCGGRIELYLVAEPGTDGYELASAALAAVLQAEGLGVTDIASSLYFAAGADAACHLLSVAAGIDEFAHKEEASDMVAFLRRAERESRQAMCLGAISERLFHEAAFLAGESSARPVKNDAESAAAVGVRLSQRIFGHLNCCSAFVSGAEALVEAFAAAFERAGMMEIAIENDGEGFGFHDLSLGEVRELDVLVVGRPEVARQLDRRFVRETVRLRRGRSLLIMDCCPEGSAVDERAASIDGVFLYTLADLAAIASEVPHLFSSAIGSREKAVRAALDRVAPIFQ